MSNTKYIFYLSISITAYNGLCMHNLSQITAREALLTNLGLSYLPEIHQKRFFELLSEGNTSNSEFKKLVSIARSNKAHQYHLQPIRKEQQRRSF